MENKAVIEILKQCESLLDGHFLLSSGKHSDRYCQCAKLLQYPGKAEQVLAVVAEQVKALGATAVVGPAMGGIVPAYELARQLKVKGVFTEREDGEMRFRRGFSLSEHDRVLIGEDVITTGKSTMETVRAVEAQGAKVIGLCCIVDRSAPGVDLPLPVYSATALSVKTFEAASCPLCKEKLPIEKPGSRKRL